METVTFRVRSLVWFATGVVVTLLATLVVLQAWRVDAAPGDLDSTLVPITPCRLVDTRQPGEPALGAGETRTITAHGTNGPIAGSQCTIPDDAVGLSMNVTAVDATASLSRILCEELIPPLVVGGSVEAESAGEMDVEGVEGTLPSLGAGAEITASLVGDVACCEAQQFQC